MLKQKWGFSHKGTDVFIRKCQRENLMVTQGVMDKGAAVNFEQNKDETKGESGVRTRFS